MDQAAVKVNNIGSVSSVLLFIWLHNRLLPRARDERPCCSSQVEALCTMGFTIPNDTPTSDHRTTAIPVKTVVLSVLFSVLAIFIFAMSLIYCRNVQRMRVENRQHKNEDFGQRQKVKRDFWGRPKAVPEDTALDLAALPAPYMLPQNARTRDSVDSLARMGTEVDGAYRLAAIRKSVEVSVTPATPPSPPPVVLEQYGRERPARIREPSTLHAAAAQITRQYPDNYYAAPEMSYHALPPLTYSRQYVEPPYPRDAQCYDRQYAPGAHHMPIVYAHNTYNPAQNQDDYGSDRHAGRRMGGARPMPGPGAWPADGSQSRSSRR